jgi:hypothetical protein
VCEWKGKEYRKETDCNNTGRAHAHTDDETARLGDGDKTEHYCEVVCT